MQVNILWVEKRITSLGLFRQGCTSLAFKFRLVKPYEIEKEMPVFQRKNFFFFF